MTIEVFSESPVSVPFAIQGVVFETATVDSQAARIRIVAAAEGNKKQVQQKSQPAQSIMLLDLSGKGTKTFEYTLRLPLEKAGGWR